MNAPGLAPSRENQGIDHVLLSVIIVLTVFGVISVYSAGSERSMALYGSPHTMFLSQLTRAGLGFLILFGLATLPYRIWQKFAVPGMILAGVLLALLFVDGMADTSKGATRWLHLGGFRFQPSEVARYAVVFFIAAWAHRKGAFMDRIEDGVLKPVGLALVLAVMVLLQPDFSTAAMMMAAVFFILFVAGVRFTHLLMAIASLAVVGALVIWTSPHMRARVLTFLSPDKDQMGAGYQILQSWIGLGRGGITGVGPGGSRQKLFFLPDAHTDFIYSIIGEEWGLVGTTLTLVLFMVMILRGFRIALRCPDPFGSYLAAGITFSIGIYALANMGIAVGVLPNTGLPLPLVSYGGTSLVMTLAALGIVLNISRYQVAKRPRSDLQGRRR